MIRMSDRLKQNQLFALVTKYGASRLSDIDPKDFAAVLKDAEAIENE